MTIHEKISDPNVLTHAIAKAWRKVVQRHQAAGLPIVLWRDGEIVYVSPEEAERM